MTEAFPPIGDDPWELRFTRRALADLGADAARDAPGDIATVRRSTTYSRVVDDFVGKRKDRPDAPGDPLHSAGRPDIISLHSASGGRAATWHDPDNAVVWFVGFTPEHDYTVFEQRAATGVLLPDEDDEILLELEREQRDFEQRFRPGVTALVGQAAASPGVPQRGTVGGLLRLELSAVVVPAGGALLGDVWIIVHLPLHRTATDVPGWPGSDLLTTVAGVVGEGELDYTTEVPDGDSWRPLDPAGEMGIVVRNVTLRPSP